VQGLLLMSGHKSWAEIKHKRNLDTEVSEPLPTSWTYLGPRDAVRIMLPSGRRLTVARGETIQALPNEAEALSKLTASWTSSSDTMTQEVTQ